MKKCLVVAVVIGLLRVGSHLGEARDSSPGSAQEIARLLNEAFVAVAEMASPSVVVINVTTRNPGLAGDPQNTADLEEMSPDLRRFLEEHLPQREGAAIPKKGVGPLAYDSQGSGLILRADGYLLTNRHVVENADQIQVRFADGRELPAEVRGMDAQSDVAVLKVEARDLTPAKLGDSKTLRVGEFAIAIGAPFDLDYSVTFGHVSAKGRNNILNDRALDQDFIQTDAQINPGNSGGPLVNLNGEVIGINTLIRGMHTGIGFAIPINQAREVAEQLILSGRYLRTWLGIGIRSLRENPPLREAFPDAKDGVVVKQIEAQGPSKKSDLKPGDLITAVDGHLIATANDLKTEIRGKRVGDWVTLDVTRGGKSQKIKVRAEAMPDRDHPPPHNAPHAANDEETNLGFTVRPLSQEEADREGLGRDHGVAVTDVAPGSIAESYGIKPGYIVTEMNRKPITGPKQFREMLRSADLKKGIPLTYLSEGSARFEFLKSGE